MNNSSVICFKQATTGTFVGSVLILVTGLMANVLLLVALFKDPLKCFRTPSAYFVMNTAITDLLNLLAILIGRSVTAFDTHETSSNCDSILYVWLVSVVVFQAGIFMTFLSAFSSALERYLAISRAIWHRVHVTARACVVWMLSTWLCSMVLAGFSSWMLFHKYRQAQIQLIQIHSAIIFLATILVYLAAYFSIRKQRFNMPADDLTSDRRAYQTRLANESRFLFTIFIVTCFLFVTILPWLVGISAVVVSTKKTETYFFNNATGLFLYHVMNFLFLFKFVVNPFIYIWRLPRYRKTFLLLYFHCANSSRQ